MKQEKNLNKISDFIEKEVEKQTAGLKNNNKILEVKKQLEKFSSQDEDKFTFTVGEVNAYLG